MRYATTPDPTDDLISRLSQALVQKYNHGTDKQGRFRLQNPDMKPRGEPKIRKLTRAERAKLKKHDEQTAA